MRPTLLTLLCLFFALAGCGEIGRSDSDWQGRMSGAPALWHVTGQGGEAWLFGSVHALPERVRWSTPVLDTAMEDSDRLVLEVVGLEDGEAVSAVFQRLGNSPGQPPLEQRLPPTLVAKAEAIGGVSPSRYATLESWAAAITLASLSTRNLPISSANGVEQALGRRYRALGKPIIGLETVDRQFAYFDTLSEADQRAMLASVVADFTKAPASYRALVDGWLAGDVAAMDASTRQGLLARPSIRAAILVERNRNWTDQIDAMLRLGARPFVAVGAAHLAGPDSVAAMLRARGYRVERVQ